MFRESSALLQRLTGMLRDHGVKIMVVDSDGYNWKLIPLFMEGGVTGMGRWKLPREWTWWKFAKHFRVSRSLAALISASCADGNDRSRR